MPPGSKILVIDDEEDVRGVICESLELCGFFVIQAADGEQGLEALKSTGALSVIVTDIMMPRKDGFEVIAAVKKSFPAVKVIAMSGGGKAGTIDVLELAEKSGADVVMPKPVDIDELEKVVARLSAV